MPVLAKKSLPRSLSIESPTAEALQFLQGLGFEGRAKFIERHRKRDLESQELNQELHLYPELNKQEKELLDRITNKSRFKIPKLLLAEAVGHAATGNPFGSALLCLRVLTKHFDDGIGEDLTHYLWTESIKKEALRLVRNPHELRQLERSLQESNEMER